MQIAGLLKTEKTVELMGKKVTVKRYPLGFYEYLQAKSLEDRKFERDEKGLITGVLGVADYDTDFFVDQLVNGIRSWDLTDDNGYQVPLTREACLAIVEDYAEFAGALLMEINLHNTPLVDKSKKK